MRLRIASTTFLLGAAFLAATGGPAVLAHAGEAYCYAFADDSQALISDPTLYITPVFESDAPDALLESEFGETLPGGGLSTCITEDDEPDVKTSWQQLIDDSKAQGAPITMMPPIKE